MFFNGEVDNESTDLGAAHFTRVAQFVETNILTHPLQVGFLSAAGVVFCAQGVTILIEKFFWRHTSGLQVLRVGRIISVYRILYRNFLYNTTIWGSYTEGLHIKHSWAASQ